MDSNNWRVKRDPSDLPAAGTPNRSFQPRRSNGLNDSRDSPKNGGSSSNFSSPTGRSSFQSRDSRRPLNENSNNKAIEEGRRLYVVSYSLHRSPRGILISMLSLPSGGLQVNLVLETIMLHSRYVCILKSLRISTIPMLIQI